MTANEIAQYIREARRWVSAFELSAVSAIPERQLREIIHDMRISGNPALACIISSKRGYCWCEDEGIVETNLASLDKHARRQLAAASGVRKAVRRAQKGQMALL